MKWLVRLYPASWQRRYGEEFTAVLASQRFSIGLVMDVIGGAVDAHLHPQIRNQKQENAKGDTMTNEMLKRCASGGPRLSPVDQRIASLTMLFSSLVFALVYIVLRKIYHAEPAVEAVGYASFPALWLIYEQTAYLRKRSLRTQAVIALAIIGGMYGFMYGVCEIAARL